MTGFGQESFSELEATSRRLFIGIFCKSEENLRDVFKEIAALRMKQFDGVPCLIHEG
jgi:hypothetical protein